LLIGIDLGTTNSEAAFINDRNEPEIIPAKEGNFGGKNFPSVVAFRRDGKIIVGHAAKRSPFEKVTGFKRHMGSTWKYYSKTLGKEFTPQELSAFVLKKIVEDAETYLRKKVTGAVITVPAYFNDNQRQATKDAARIAGIEVRRLLNEPTAAAIAYGLGRAEDEKIAVLDLGGGTFDVTVMRVSSGVFEVLATSGDTQLGGIDFDNALMDHLKKKYGVEPTPDMLRQVELAKMELSSVDVTYVGDIEITREEFERVIEPVLKRLEGPIDQALRDAGLTPAEIDRVVPVGGSTKVPAVIRKFESIFGEDKIVGGVDPVRAVAIGAAIEAAVLEGRWKGEAPILVDVTPLSLGVEVQGGLVSVLIPRNTPIPYSAKKLYTTASDYQTAVRIKVVQGERRLASECIPLGEIVLDGIPPAPAGVPKIEVTFTIDENGILVVKAKDLGTGKEKELTIEAPHRLSEEEIQRIIEESRKYEEEDRKLALKVELQSKILQIKKALNDLKSSEAYEKMDEESRRKVDEIIRRLDEVESRGDLEKIEKEIAEIARKLYGGQDGP